VCRVGLTLIGPPVRNHGMPASVRPSEPSGESARASASFTRGAFPCFRFPSTAQAAAP
jgi:hypothetical protein